MVFAGLTFLTTFLPAVIILYYLTFLVPERYGRNHAKNAVLLLASLWFYAWGEPVYLVFLLLSVGINYLFGLEIGDFCETHPEKGRRNYWLIAGVVFNVAFLCCYKYMGLGLSTLTHFIGYTPSVTAPKLPVGISFYTFQAISYLADLASGKLESEKNPFRFALYISLFPQLIAGPIVTYTEMRDQLISRRETMDGFAQGTKRLIQGLAKKVLIANTAGAMYETIRSGVAMEGNPGVVLSWLAAFAYTIQIYFDFSGYSDMAVGMGQIFGLRLPENFLHPYTAKSIRDFFRKWHVTLSFWFRDYVYIPLGGNRRGNLIMVRNLLIVWALTGMWHGAAWNFLLWGLYFGVLLILERFLIDRVRDFIPGVVQWAGTFLLVVFGWVLFSGTEMPVLTEAMHGLFGGYGVWQQGAALYLRAYGPMLLIALLLSLNLPQRLVGWLYTKVFIKTPTISGIIYWCFYGAIAVMAIAGLVSDSYQPFLYFRF